MPIYIFPCYKYYNRYRTTTAAATTTVLEYGIKRNKHPPSSPCLVLSAVLMAQPPDQKGKKKGQVPQALYERHGTRYR